MRAGLCELSYQVLVSPAVTAATRLLCSSAIRAAAMRNFCFQTPV